jgi:hypothetical protein
MPKQIEKPHAVTSNILRGLGRGATKPRALTALDDDDVNDTDFDDFRESEYRSDWRTHTGDHSRGGLVHLHPVAIKELTTAIASAQRFSRDGIRELAEAIAASLQFHPQLIQDLAKAVAAQLELLPETIAQLAKAIYGRLEKNMAALVEENTKQADGRIACSECSVGDRRSVHPFHDMTTEDVRIFMGWKSKAAIYARTQDGKMPPPVSAVTPYTYDPHCIALLKDHELVFPQARYDRDLHLALLPRVEAERAAKKRSFSKRQSAMMKRENKKRAVEREKQKNAATAPAKKPVTPKSTHTRTSRTKKH